MKKSLIAAGILLADILTPGFASAQGDRHRDQRQPCRHDDLQDRRGRQVGATYQRMFWCQMRQSRHRPAVTEQLILLWWAFMENSKA